MSSGPEQTSASDADLIRAVARGDEDACANLYDRHSAILLGIALRILRDQAEAEDVLQEIFLQIWQLAATFDEARGRALPWLTLLARSRALDRLRSRKLPGRVAAEGGAEPDAPIPEPVEGAIGSEEPVEPVEPPAELRARVLERVAVLAERKRGSAGSGERRVFSWRPLPAFGALAAVAMAAAFVMYLWGLSVRVEEIERQLAVEHEKAIFLASPETTTIVLAGTDAAPKARAKLAYDRHTGRALLFGYDLPQVPEGKAYQLWFIAAGKPLPGRPFTPDRTGTGAWHDEVPAEGREAAVFAVTLEPAGGVTAPSGPMVLKSVSVS